MYQSVTSEIESSWNDEIAFLQKLVSYPSTVGSESEIQSFLAQYLIDMGLSVDTFMPDIHRLSKTAGFGIPEQDYEDRPVVVGKWQQAGSQNGKSLILQGHVDVVSAGPEHLWQHSPWAGVIQDGRMYGRGTCDMKAGIAAIIFAVRAIQKSGYQLNGDLFIETVIEEECTGNGALATLERGYKADGVLIAESTNLQALHSQVGVLWLRITIMGSSAHVHADEGVNAIEKAYLLIQSLKQYEVMINQRSKHQDFADIHNPLHVNIGKIQGGDWPSKVPATCTVEARIGFYPGQSIDDIKSEVTKWLMKSAMSDEWLAKVPPEIAFFGFNAPGISIDTQQPLFASLATAHQNVTEDELEYQVETATTDLRQYVHFYDIPGTCYGASGGNMHSIDEWVDLQSVQVATKVIAEFILNWCGVHVQS